MMEKPRREDFKTKDKFLDAVVQWLCAQHDAHVIDQYWHLRINAAKLHPKSCTCWECHGA